MRQAVVGVDIGGKSTVVGVFNEAMELAAKRVIPTLKPDFPAITNKPAVYFDCLAETIEVFRHVGSTLAGKLLTAVYLLNPEVIIIGGGVAAAGEFLLTPIRTAIADNYPKLRGPKVCVGELGDSAGLIGAAAFASRQSRYL